MKKILSGILLFALLLSLCGCNSSTYKQAVAQLNSGQYESALALFKELAANDYKDSKKLFPFYFINFRITGGAPGEDLHGNVLATKTSVIK